MGFRSKVIFGAIGFFFAAVFGIPLITSYPSYLWHMTKFNVQGLNCLSDTSKALIEFDTSNNSKQIGDDYEKIGRDLDKCRRGMDFNKSSVSFVQDEFKRYKTSNRDNADK